MDAAVLLVAERGFGGMAVRKVCERAGVSAKTFYDFFEDREDCFLAVFDYAAGELAVVLRPAYEAERGWGERIRGGLHALLVFLDGEPQLRSVLVLEALRVGPRVLARRAELLGVLQAAVEEGREGQEAPRELPPLTGEGVVGAVFGVIYARLTEPQPESGPEPLVGLLNALMATVVLPYRGHEAAAVELSRRAPEPLVLAGSRVGRERLTGQRRPRPASIDFRITQRRYRLLAAVAELGAGGPAPNSRKVSEAAQIPDESHISHLMAGLAEQGFIHNDGGHIKAWRLTPTGEETLHAGPLTTQTHTIKEPR